MVIIFSLAAASIVIPIIIYAFMSTQQDLKAAYALHDLANQCKSLRERRDLACTSWQQSKADALKLRQQNGAELGSNCVQPLRTASDCVGGYDSRLRLIVCPDMFESA